MRRWLNAPPTEWVIRSGFLLVAAGLTGLVSGTLNVDSAPAWPRPEMWAGFAGVAAFGAVAAVFRVDHAFRATIVFIVVATALLRGLGYLFFPSDRIGFNGAAVGAYAMLVGVALVIGFLDQERLRIDSMNDRNEREST